MSRTAVILNPNAKGMSRRTRLWFEEEFYSTKNIEVMVTASSKQLDKAYNFILNPREEITHVLPGGGDGSVFNLYNALARLTDSNEQLPTFILNKLGTGNGVHETVGAKRGKFWIKKILYKKNLENLVTKKIPLLKANIDDGESIYSFCGGEGIHSNVIHEYEGSKARWSGFLGYAKAVAKTLWRSRKKSFPIIEISTKDKEVIKINQPNDEGEKIETQPGEIIYNGPAGDVLVGSTGWFGYKFMAFPLMVNPTVPGYLQLRIFTHETMEELFKDIAQHPLALKNGTFRSPKVKDFLVKNIKQKIGGSIQLYGDAIESSHQELSLSYADRKLTAIDFNHLPYE
jgi:hypothetical protein